MMNSTFTTLTLALLAAAGLQAGTAQAQRAVDSCGADGKLRPASQAGVNLVIKGDPGPNGTIVPKTCTVPAGTYKFGNVNILEGGTLDFADAVIDFWSSGILVEKGGTLSGGTVDKPIGTGNGIVTLHLWGKDANAAGTLPDVEGQGIACLSESAKDTPENPPADKPAAPCGIPYGLWYQNLDTAMAMPVPPAQAVKISAVTLPQGESYPPGRTDDYFYAYDPLFYDGAAEPLTKRVGYFGYKVLGVSYGGSLKLHGKKGGTYAALDANCKASPSTSGSSWARLAKTVLPTDPLPHTVTFDRTLTLKKGDRIVVTTTDYLPGHSEEMTVSADVACSDTVTVDEKFQYIHNGETYPLGAVAGRVGLDPKLQAAGADTRAAVGVLTRSIRIVSGGDALGEKFPDEPAWVANQPPPPPGYFFGGHVVARQGFRTFEVQGVEFRQLGQGGKIGHYPVHFHHARRTTAGTILADSSINESMTRFVVIHGTQDVTLARNVGYKSIGHGFYLEDGTEINNVLTANLGVFARAAVQNAQNPRQVPGILAAPDLHASQGKDVEYRSDYQYPTVFWIMNAYNDFKDNMAAGAGSCGVCYWLLPGYNSGMSREMQWASYASIQSVKDRAGMAPLKSFVGNACTTAMTSFQTIKDTEVCQGIGPGAVNGDVAFPHPLNLPPIRNPLAPRKDPPPGTTDAAKVQQYVAAADAYYPKIADGGHFPTRCTGDDCSTEPPRCSAGNEAACMVTVLDHYTTSFNWAPFNFAAIWLRPQWYLVTDSVITDVQQAGLTMVTGGGYSDSDVIPGHWALVRKTVFIGNTQDCEDCKITESPYASNGGPFNPRSRLLCAMDKDLNRPGAYCLSIAEGISHQMSNFGMYQRLFSVYDGPAFQDSNAYLNIRKRKIDDCTPLGSTSEGGICDPADKSTGRQSAWIAGYVLGLLKETPPAPAAPFCYMPNAAIGWKQPNGFYYPPAFHSQNLFFADVDYRHFVISPRFHEGTYQPDLDEVFKTYCIWPITKTRLPDGKEGAPYGTPLFTGFAGNDRQTVLNDDDGSLTGYKETTVINFDPFFASPDDAYQCRSDKSSRTSPYEYVSTVIYPACVIAGTCAKAPVVPPEPNPTPNLNDGDWNRACTSDKCYGIPLWRQDLMPKADKGVPKSIRMMGQETGQRGSLTVNHGTYYFDTTVDRQTQLTDGCTGADCVINVFKKNEAYYLFLIFAKETTAQKYRFYVGDPSFDLSSIKLVRGDIGKNPIAWARDPVTGKPIELDLPAGRVSWFGSKPESGVVEVEFVLADVPGIAAAITAAEQKKCQPATYCAWNAAASNGVGRCEAVGPGGLPNGDSSVCQWANADLDCPDGGCVGFKFTLPGGFATRPKGAPNDPRPIATCVPKGSPWTDRSLKAQKVSDGTCPVDEDLEEEDFCGSPSPKSYRDSRRPASPVAVGVTRGR